LLSLNDAGRRLCVPAGESYETSVLLLIVVLASRGGGTTVVKS
jgi:hypothetical protein